MIHVHSPYNSFQRHRCLHTQSTNQTTERYSVLCSRHGKASSFGSHVFCLAKNHVDKSSTDITDEAVFASHSRCWGFHPQYVQYKPHGVVRNEIIVLIQHISESSIECDVLPRQANPRMGINYRTNTLGHYISTGFSKPWKAQNSESVATYARSPEGDFLRSLVVIWGFWHNSWHAASYQPWRAHVLGGQPVKRIQNFGKTNSTYQSFRAHSTSGT